MADNELVITLSLDDKVSKEVADVLKNMESGAKKSAAEASKSFEDFGKSVQRVGKDIGQVSQAIGFFGAGIIAPFALALKDASKDSFAVSDELNRLNDVTRRFQNTLATSVLPVLRDFSSTVNGLVIAFEKVPEPIRNSIAQGILLSGIFLVLASGAGLLTKQLFSLVGNSIVLMTTFRSWVAIPANAWLLGVGAAIVVVLGLMLKFKPVADAVLSTFQVMFLVIENGFTSIKIAFELTIASMLETLTKFSSVISQLPSVLGAVVREFGASIQQASTSLRASADQDFSVMEQRIIELNAIMASGQGSWSVGFDNLKKSAMEFLDGFGTKTAETVDRVSVLERKGLEISRKVNADKVSSLASTLQQAASLNKSFAAAYKAVAIGEAIMSTAAGVARAFKDYKFPVSLAVAALVGAAGAVQIATIASQSFAVGTPSVPQDMSANIHKDEMIVPATFAEAIRSGQLTLSGSRRNDNEPMRGGGDVHITIERVEISSDQDVVQFAEDLGFEIERQGRRARSNS